MIRIPTNRTPTHPGEMLLEEFLIPMHLTQRELADSIHVPYQRINDLINGRRGMTPNTALRLAKYFGNTPAFWMNLQLRWDLYFAQQEDKLALESITPHQLLITGNYMPQPPRYEQQFLSALKSIFIGAKVEGESGYINLMKIKAAYQAL